MYNHNTYYEHEDGYIIGVDIKGEEFIFDKEDLEKVKKYTWSIQKQASANYYMVMSKQSKNKGNKTLRLHRYLMDVWDENIEIDHINRNPLDNRKCNLRIADDVLQSVNRNKKSDNTSGVTGVYWHKHQQRWYSKITINKKVITLGYYSIKENAIIARLKAEKEYWGDDAPQKHLFKNYDLLTNPQENKYLGCNTDKIDGVTVDNRNSKKWRVRLKHNKKMIINKSYDSKSEAVLARLQGEVTYFPEERWQKHLWEEYNFNYEKNNENEGE